MFTVLYLYNAKYYIFTFYQSEHERRKLSINETYKLAQLITSAMHNSQFTLTFSARRSRQCWANDIKYYGEETNKSEKVVIELKLNFTKQIEKNISKQSAET